MSTSSLRQPPTVNWSASASRKKNQRGATRVASRKTIRTSIKSTLSFFKVALWVIVAGLFVTTIYFLTTIALGYINQPIAKVAVLGDLDYIDSKALQSTIEPFVSKGFLDVDLEALRNKLERTPWISHIEVERVWPNQIKLHLYGKKPIARWGEHSLLNSTGDAFTPQTIATYGDLPLLSGPAYAQQQVMQQYQILSQLLRPEGISIASLSVTDSGSWSLISTSGVEIILGNDDLVEKTRRFIRAYESDLTTKMDNIARIDLRYVNGLAVAWKDPSKELLNKNLPKMVARQ